MTVAIKFAVCPQCADVFEKLFAHQKFCSVYCAFWSRVEKTTTCWLWTGSKATSAPYGEFRYNGKLIRTHRFSYELHYGPIGAEKSVLHHCDVHQCVRPVHLYEGTQADNMADVRSRHRSARKLTIEQVVNAETRILNGEPLNRIAKEYGVSQPTISRVQRMMEKHGRLPAR